MSKLCVKQMMAAANAVIDTVSVHDAIGRLDDPDVAFIDVRDAAERAANGEIPGAVHAPRGHLGFSPIPRRARTIQFSPATGGSSCFAPPEASRRSL